MNDRDIGAGVHYPVPLHRQPSLEHLNFEQGDFPEAEQAASEVLSLPVHSKLKQSELEHVVHTLTEAIESLVSEPRNQSVV